MSAMKVPVLRGTGGGRPGPCHWWPAASWAGRRGRRGRLRRSGRRRRARLRHRRWRRGDVAGGRLRLAQSAHGADDERAVRAHRDRLVRRRLDVGLHREGLPAERVDHVDAVGRAQRHGGAVGEEHAVGHALGRVGHPHEGVHRRARRVRGGAVDTGVVAGGDDVEVAAPGDEQRLGVERFPVRVLDDVGPVLLLSGFDVADPEDPELAAVPVLVADVADVELTVVDGERLHRLDVAAPTELGLLAVLGEADQCAVVGVVSGHPEAMGILVPSQPDDLADVLVGVQVVGGGGGRQ